MSTDRTAELLNPLSAMSREIGTFRAETKQQFAEVNSRFDNLETGMRAGFDQVRKDIRMLKHKYDEFAVDTFDLRGRQRDLEKRAEVLGKRAGITDSV